MTKKIEPIQKKSWTLKSIEKDILGALPDIKKEKDRLVKMVTDKFSDEGDADETKREDVRPQSQKRPPKPVIAQQDAILVPPGTRVHAIRDGIASVHRDTVEGHIVTIADPVFYGIGNFLGFGKDDAYVYSGFASIQVKDGDEIKSGQVIGIARPMPGSSGKSYIRITKKVDGSRSTMAQSELHSAVKTSDFSKIPREGITSTNASRPVDAPIKGSPGTRDTNTYNSVIDQFQVDKNPRYTPRAHKPGGSLQTFCNIFVWDVTEAMGSPLPHWVDGNGNPAQPGKGSRELNGNASVDWLAQHGSRFGWKEVDEAEAQEYANKGHAVVAGQKEIGKSKIGHVAMVRPGKITRHGPSVANAGGRNINKAQVAQVFGAGYKNGLIRYWANLA
jgi:hypothetical protein